MKDKDLINPEYAVTLSSVEIELILQDVHTHLAQLLDYAAHTRKVAITEGWIHLRINTFRILAAKLEGITLKNTDELEEA